MTSPSLDPQRRCLPHALPFVLLLALLALFPLFALAQQHGSQPDAAADQALPKLELKQAPEAGDGRLAAIQGQIDQEGLRIALPDLSVLQPVELLLATTEPSRPLRLEVTKFGYDGVLRSATTDAEGLAVLRFRTQMGVALGIEPVDARAQEPIPFQLVAWVGDESEAVPQNVFKPMPEQQAGGSRWWPAVVATVAILALAGLALIFLKRRKSA